MIVSVFHYCHTNCHTKIFSLLISLLILFNCRIKFVVDFIRVIFQMPPIFDDPRLVNNIQYLVHNLNRFLSNRRTV